MKKNFAFSRSVSLLALLVSILPLSAHAGSLSEAQLMGIYQTCLMSQTRPLFEAAYSPNGEAPQGGVGDLSEFHDPLVGPASLNFIQDFDMVKGGRPYALRRSVTHLQYQSGKLMISLVDDAGEWISMPYSGGDEGHVFLKTKPMYLPYFQYKDERFKSTSYDNFGSLEHAAWDAITEKPQLVVYKGPNELPFLNDDTGQPFRDAAGNAITLNVSEYKACLYRYVNRAYAAPGKAEVASNGATIENAPGTKRVAESASAGRDQLPAAGASQTVLK